MRPDIPYSYRPETPYGQWSIGFGVSLAFHFLVIVVIVFMPSVFFGNRLDTAKVLDVEMVSLNPELPPAPGGTGAPVAKKKPAKQKPPAEKAEPAEAEPEPEPDAIPIKTGKEKNINPVEQAKAPEPEMKKSLKKKTFKPDKAIEAAVKRIEEESKTDQLDSVQKRIAEMQNEVGSVDQKEAPDDNRMGDTPGSGGFSSGGIAGGRFSAMEIYQAEVAQRMKQNWTFSPELAGNTTGLESIIVVKIISDGRITDVWYEKRSGNTYLDESAYKTVMKSNPLPPLPGGNSEYHLVMVFTPRGLNF